MRGRNPAARFSKKALGKPPKARIGYFRRQRLQAKLEQAVIDGKLPACDECGHPTRWRQNSKDGSTFLGCTGYPKCKATKSKGAWAKQSGNAELADKLAKRRAKAARRRQRGSP